MLDMESILSSEKLATILGPIGCILAVGLYFITRWYRELLVQYNVLQETRMREMHEMQTAYDALQEKRIAEAQHMQQDFMEFSSEMSRTLEAVLKALRER